MEAYRELMSSEPAMYELLEQGTPLTPGILGGLAFFGRLPRRVRARFETTESRLPLELVAQYVANLYGLRVDEIASRSREHRLVLARALIAWYATEHCSATLSEVAKLLGRDVSSLSRIVCRYRRSHPKLFSPSVFSPLQSRIEPVARRSKSQSRVNRYVASNASVS